MEDFSAYRTGAKGHKQRRLRGSGGKIGRKLGTCGVTDTKVKGSDSGESDPLCQMLLTDRSSN